MPKAASLQSSFTAGEVSPLVQSRADSPRYKQGLATCLNYIPALQGPLLRRPGTKYLTNVKDSSNPPVLIPFQFSITQAYVLEFGDKYVRFYANNGQITTSGTVYNVTGTGNNPYNDYSRGQNFFATRPDTNPQLGEIISASGLRSPGTPLEVASPYAVADVPLLRYTQNADTLYIFHPNYPPYKLQRFGQQYWTLKQVFFQDGPYLPLNSYATVGDSVPITITSTQNPPPVGAPVGDSTFSAQASPVDTVTGAAAQAGTNWVLLTFASGHHINNGQKIFVSGVGGTTEANNNDASNSHPSAPMFWVASVQSPTVVALIGSNFSHAYTSGGAAAPALFDCNTTASLSKDFGRTIALISGGARVWGTINNVTNASLATAILGPTSSLAPNTTITTWQLGVFSPGNGFPACGTFHQNRLVLAGVPNYPQQVNGSIVGNFENFAPSNISTLVVSDASAFSFDLASKDVNALRWILSNTQGLLAGSYVAEWSMAPGNGASAALSPLNFQAIQTSFFGSANVDAVQAGNAAIYVQRAQKKIRELNYFFQVGTFRSTDMTEISEHITLPSVTKLVLQKETQPLVWGIRSDGNLISMLYNRDDASLQAGWTRHSLGGQSDASGTNPLVLSAAVIPAPDLSFDQMWLVVQRYINGQNVVGIEYMTKIFDGSMNQEDAFQLDCGATYDVPKTITGVSNANPAVVTAPSHGFSNGDRVRIEGVVGVTKSTTDVNGNVTITSPINNLNFLVAGAATNTFQLTDFQGNNIDTTTLSAYVSGGQVRKMVTTISGLTWLENETVGVLADGAWHPDVQVSNTGSITLQYPAAKVQIGYRYNSDGKLLRTEAGAADGTSIGKTRRTTRAAFNLYRCGDLSIGTDFSRLTPVKFTQADQQLADEPTPLFSGLIREGLESAYDFESQICFRQNSPLPGNIVSITSLMEEFDV